MHYISKDLMAPDAADNLLDKMKVEIRTRKLEVALWQKMSCFLANQKNIEYKVVVPDKSEKYMKTVVAFANTQGGRLVIGIDDKTHQVVGVDNDSLFQAMDALTNAISDSCEPQIIPDIGTQTVDGKTVIVITVEAGEKPTILY